MILPWVLSLSESRDRCPSCRPRLPTYTPLILLSFTSRSCLLGLPFHSTHLLLSRPPLGPPMSNSSISEQIIYSVLCHLCLPLLSHPWTAHPFMLLLLFPSPITEPRYSRLAPSAGASSLSAGPMEGANIR
jgi:hypothetical protein